MELDVCFCGCIFGRWLCLWITWWEVGIFKSLFINWFVFLCGLLVVCVWVFCVYELGCVGRCVCVFVFNSIGMGVYYCIFELMMVGGRVYLSMFAYLCIVLWCVLGGCLCLCIWDVSICEYEYIFELCVFFYLVLFCVCGLWRSVFLGDI